MLNIIYNDDITQLDFFKILFVIERATAYRLK